MSEGTKRIEEEAAAPGQRHIIRRPRLERLLDETEARIIMLVAPAGYGKTTLARQWLERRRFAWYRATPASADVAEFAFGIASAVGTPPSMPREADFLNLTAPAPELAQRTLKVLHDTPDDLWLVIDDYQARRGSDADEFFTEIVDQCERRVLITTRQRPSWGTARRILYGEVFEVGSSTLAMTMDEGASVLSGRPVDDLPGLLALADGWPVVIGLAAMLDSIPVGAADLAPTLFDFFADEHYRGLATADQRRLCTLAWFPEVPVDDANALLAATGGAFRLSEVEPLAPVVGGRLSLHPLVRSFLRGRSHVELSGDEIIRIYHDLVSLRAWDDAYALAADFELAPEMIALLGRALSDLLRRGRTATVHRWTEEMRVRGLADPILDLAEAEAALRRGEYSEAEALAVRSASRAVSRSVRSRARTVAGRSAHLDSAIGRAIEHYRSARQEAEADDDLWAALWGELVAAAEDDPAKVEILTSTLEEIATSEPLQQLRVESARLFGACINGGLLEALPRGRAALPLLGSIEDPYVRTSFLNSLTHSLLFSAHYEDALVVAAREFDDSSRHGLTFVLSHVKIAEAVALAGLRRFGEATSSLAESQQLRAPRDLHASANEVLVRARIAATVGDHELALKLLERPLAEMPSAVMTSEWHATRSIIINAVESSPDEADAVARLAASGPVDAFTRTLLVLNYAISSLRHETVIDAGALAEAVRSSGHCDALVFSYRTFPQLVEMLAGSEAARPLMEGVLERARDHGIAKRFGLPLRSRSDPREVLSPREREVYELIARGLSNREIAAQLYISEVTVKVHVRHILEKLGAKTRTQAALLGSRAPRS